MKFSLLVLLLFTYSTFLTAQVPSLHEPDFGEVYQSPAPHQKITGRVLNLSPEAADTLEVGFAAVSILADEQQELSVPLSADGKFTLDLPENYPLWEIWFWLGDYYYGVLLVEDELNIELDLATLSAEGANGNWDAEGVRFSGLDGELTRLRNQLISDHRATRQNFFRQIIENLRDRQKSLADKQALVDSIYREIRTMDEVVLKGAPNREKQLLLNERETEYFANSVPLYWGEEMPKDMQERYLSNRPLAMSNETRSFYSYYATYQLRKSMQAEPQLDTTLEGLERKQAETVRYFDYLYANNDVTRADLCILFSSDKDPLTNHMKLTEALDRIQTPWIRAIKERHYERSVLAKKKMEEALDSKVEITSPKELGTPAGGFAFGAKQYLVDENLSGQELLNKIRGAFGNRAIYLDFWAVWCSPCLMEMPFSAKLHQKTDGLPVEYVYLCTDSGGSEVQWENLIVKHEVPGTHLYVPTKVHSQLMEIFNGRGFPTYVLLQPDGEPVLDVDRPSQLTREKVETLLGRE